MTYVYHPSTAFAVVSRVQSLLMGQTMVGDRVFLNLNSALEHEEAPAIVIEMSEDNADAYAQRHDRVMVQFRVVLVSRSEQWQSELDRLRSHVHHLISSDSLLSQQLQGLRRTVTKMGAASADFPMAFIDQQYIGQYVSHTHSLIGVSNDS